MTLVRKQKRRVRERSEQLDQPRRRGDAEVLEVRSRVRERDDQSWVQRVQRARRGRHHIVDGLNQWASTSIPLRERAIPHMYHEVRGRTQVAPLLRELGLDGRRELLPERALC